LKARELSLRLVPLGVLGATLAVSCNSDLALILTGKRCRMDLDPPCVQGFECIDGLCQVHQAIEVPGPDASVGGGVASGATGGEGGTDGAGSVGGSPALGGAGSQGGTFSIDDIPDASVFLDGGPDGCVPVDLYRDRDNDSVGDIATHAFGCLRDGWVEVPGDCRDDIPEVHPGQGDFFGSGYSDALKPEGLSFDYDCNRVEESDTGNVPNAAAPQCQAVLDIVLCPSTNGYLMTARNDPNDPGINRLCGSATVIACSTAGGCHPESIPTQQPFKCR
jgi:hypothetical protein